MKSVAAALFALLIFSAPFVAKAQAEESQFFHRPAIGEHEFTVHWGLVRGRVQTSAPNAQVDKYDGFRDLGVEYGYGISEDVDFSVDFSFSNFSQGPTRTRGPEPIILNLGVETPLTMGKLLYGFRGTVSLAKAKIEADGDTNRIVGDVLTGVGEGGYQLEPYLGYQFDFGDNVIGAFAAYEVLNTDTDVDLPDGTGGSIINGDELHGSVFYEYMFSNDAALGAAVNYNLHGNADIVQNGVRSEYVPARATVGLDLYGQYPINDNAEFIPTVVWKEKISGSSWEQLRDMRVNLAARLGF